MAHIKLCACLVCTGHDFTKVGGRSGLFMLLYVSLAVTQQAVSPGTVLLHVPEGGGKAGCLIFFQTGFSVHNGHMRAEKSSAQKHHLEI